MKKTKALIIIFFSLYTLSAIFTACTKEELKDIFIYISTELYENTLEFSYEGENMNPNPDYSYGNISVYKLTPREASVELDFSFDYNGKHYSSSESGKLVLQASESESNDYSLYPTGDVSEPFDIHKLEDLEDESPIIGTWEKSTGGALLKFTSSKVYLCNTSTHIEYSGSFYPSENKAVITEGDVTITFYAYQEGSNKILIKQYVSDQHVEDIYYYKTSTYSCNK